MMVDNRATAIRWPPCLGYINCGGIHRDVSVEILEGACLLDPNRLVSCAALCGNVGSLARIVDVLGVNSCFGWHDRISGGKGGGR